MDYNRQPTAGIQLGTGVQNFKNIISKYLRYLVNRDQHLLLHYLQIPITNVISILRCLYD